MIKVGLDSATIKEPILKTCFLFVAIATSRPLLSSKGINEIWPENFSEISSIEEFSKAEINDLLQTFIAGWSRFLSVAVRSHLLKSPSVRIPSGIPFLPTTITKPDLLYVILLSATLSGSSLRTIKEERFFSSTILMIIINDLSQFFLLLKLLYNFTVLTESIEKLLHNLCQLQFPIF